MSSLEARLARIREASAKNIPAEPLELMHRATREVVASNVHEQALGEGDAAPGFSLTNSAGETQSLEAALAEGPAVITFFRGHW